MGLAATGPRQDGRGWEEDWRLEAAAAPVQSDVEDGFPAAGLVPARQPHAVVQQELQAVAAMNRLSVQEHPGAAFVFTHPELTHVRLLPDPIRRGALSMTEDLHTILG